MNAENRLPYRSHGYCVGAARGRSQGRWLMRRAIPIIAVLAVFAVTGPGAASGKPPVVVVPPSATDRMPPPPPSPTLQLKRGGNITRTFLERWSRPRPDGKGYSGATVTPPITVLGRPSPIGSTLPRLFTKAGSNVVVDTRLDAESVHVHLLRTRSTRARMLRVLRLDARRWQFSTLGHRRVVVRISATYSDGGDSRSRAELRRR